MFGDERAKRSATIPRPRRTRCCSRAAPGQPRSPLHRVEPEGCRPSSSLAEDGAVHLRAAPRYLADLSGGRRRAGASGHRAGNRGSIGRPANRPDDVSGQEAAGAPETGPSADADRAARIRTGTGGEAPGNAGDPERLGLPREPARQRIQVADFTKLARLPKRAARGTTALRPQEPPEGAEDYTPCSRTQESVPLGADGQARLPAGDLRATAPAASCPLRDAALDFQGDPGADQQAPAQRELPDPCCAQPPAPARGPRENQRNPAARAAAAALHALERLTVTSRTVARCTRSSRGSVPVQGIPAASRPQPFP